MSKWTKRLAVILAILMVLPLSGCSLNLAAAGRKAASNVHAFAGAVAKKIVSSVIGSSGSGLLKKFGGHTYLISDLGFTWAQAEAYCETAGGHLLAIDSEDEQKFINGVLKSGAKNSYWLGAQETKKTGNFEKWVTGEKISYTNWSEGQPDNYNKTENSLMMFKGYSLGTWNDLNDDGTCYNNNSPLFGVDNLGLIIEWESEKEGKDGLGKVVSKDVFLKNYNASGGKSSSAAADSASSGESGSQSTGKTAQSETKSASNKSASGSGGDASASTSTGIPKGKVKKAADLFSFLKIPDNYHCYLVLKLDSTVIMNGEYWYKDGNAKLNCSMSGFDFGFKTVSYFVNGTLYTCIPSQNVAIKTALVGNSFFDQSTVETMVDSGLKFKGTKAVTVDGLQCTVYQFSQSGVTADIYVRNSISTVIRCVATTNGVTVDVYFKNMDIGMVTNGDVLMTNNRYKIFDNITDYSNYMVQKAMGK